MTQKDAVFTTVVSVLSDSGIAFEPGREDVSLVLTRELRASINNVLVSGFTSGGIPLDTKFDSEMELRSYVSGLVSNWVRKDKRLNGGLAIAVKAAPKFDDPQLKALRQLLAANSDPAQKAEIKIFIKKRIAELSTGQ